MGFMHLCHNVVERTGMLTEKKEQFMTKRFMLSAVFPREE